jgi:hypothetical protein
METQMIRSKTQKGARGSVVVKVLCDKPEGRGLIPDEMIFKFTSSFLPH